MQNEIIDSINTLKQELQQTFQNSLETAITGLQDKFRENLEAHKTEVSHELQVSIGAAKEQITEQISKQITELTDKQNHNTERILACEGNTKDSLKAVDSISCTLSRYIDAHRSQNSAVMSKLDLLLTNLAQFPKDTAHSSQVHRPVQTYSDTQRDSSNPAGTAIGHPTGNVHAQDFQPLEPNPLANSTMPPNAGRLDTSFQQVHPHSHSLNQTVHSTGSAHGIMTNMKRTSPTFVHPPLVNPSLPLSDGYLDPNVLAYKELKNHIPPPKPFSGKRVTKDEFAGGIFKNWLAKFENYSVLQTYPVSQLPTILYGFLDDHAQRFADQLDPGIRMDYYKMVEALLTFFDVQESEHNLRRNLERTTQGPTESFRLFVSRIRTAAILLHGHGQPDLINETVRNYMQNNARSEIKAYLIEQRGVVLQGQAASIDSMIAFVEAKEQLSEFLQEENNKTNPVPNNSNSNYRGRGGGRYNSNRSQYTPQNASPPTDRAPNSNRYTGGNERQYNRPPRQNQYAPRNDRDVQSYPPPRQNQYAPRNDGDNQNYTAPAQQKKFEPRDRLLCNQCGNEGHSEQDCKPPRREAALQASKKIADYYQPKKGKKGKTNAIQGQNSNNGTSASIPSTTPASNAASDDYFVSPEFERSISVVGKDQSPPWHIKLEGARFQTEGSDMNLDVLRQEMPHHPKVKQIIRDTPHIYATLEGKRILVLLDTGAIANLMPEPIFQKLMKLKGQEWSGKHIRNVKIDLTGYGGSNLEITEMVTAELDIGGQVQVPPFLVDRKAKSNAILLGWPGIVAFMGNIFPSNVNLAHGGEGLNDPKIDSMLDQELTVAGSKSKVKQQPIFSHFPSVARVKARHRHFIPPHSSMLVDCITDNPEITVQGEMFLEPTIPNCQLADGLVSVPSSGKFKVVMDNSSNSPIDLKSGDGIGYLEEATPITIEEAMNHSEDWDVSIGTGHNSDDCLPPEIEYSSEINETINRLTPATDTVSIDYSFGLGVPGIGALLNELQKEEVTSCESEYLGLEGPMGLLEWKAQLRVAEVNMQDEKTCCSSPLPDSQDSIDALSNDPMVDRKTTLRSQLDGNLPETMPKAIQEFISDWMVLHHDVFSLHETDLGECTLFPHVIDTGDADPIRLPCRRTSHAYKAEVSRQVVDWVKYGICEPSMSPWAAPIVCCKKKNGKIRICCDYRMLNNCTKKFAWPMSHIDDLLDSLGRINAKVFSSLDLRQGYMQLLMDKASREKTAFTCHVGLFQFIRLPFGLCNAPATFQRTMATILADLPVDKVRFYLDDVLIATETYEEHMEILEQVFDRFRKFGLKLNPEKCEFFREQLEFLGFIVSKDGLQTQKTKVAAIANFPIPKNLKAVRSFIGMASYYRRFVTGFSTIAAPIFKLMKKDVKFEFSEPCMEAFDRLKHCLISAPVLIFPDFSKPFILETDASKDGLGAVLGQIRDDPNRPQPIAYASRSTRGPETRYSVSELEALAVIWALEHFRAYLINHKVVVITDHNALVSVMKAKQPSAKLYRWALKLQEYDLTFVYKPGRFHSVPDALSRQYEPQASGDLPLENLLNTDSFCVYGQQGDKDAVHAIMDQIAEPDAILGNPDLQLAEVSRLQQTDPFVKEMTDYILRKKLPADMRQTQVIMTTAHQYFISPQSVLYFRSTKGRNPLVYVPEGPFRKTLILENHSSLWGGHYNARCTHSKMLQYYFWPRMLQDISEQIGSCFRCAIRQGQGRRPHPELQSIVMEPKPNFCVGMDLCQYQKSPSENYQALVLMDYFTKWPEVYPLPNTKAKTIAECVIDYVSCHSAPRHFITDNGPQFTCELMKEVCAILGTKHLFTTVYHAQTDGLVERYNRTMQDQLAKCMELKGNDWDKDLKFILMAYRQLPHSSTGESPFFLQRGYDPNPISQSVFAAATSPALAEGGDYISQMEIGLQGTWNAAAERIGKAQATQKQQYDKKSKPHVFKDGDRVWRYLPSVATGPGYKLASPYVGPFVVTKVTKQNITIAVPPNFDYLNIKPITVYAGYISPTHPNIANDKFWDGKKIHTDRVQKKSAPTLPVSKQLLTPQLQATQNSPHTPTTNKSTTKSTPTHHKALLEKVVDPQGNNGDKPKQGRLCRDCNKRHNGVCFVSDFVSFRETPICSSINQLSTTEFSVCTMSSHSNRTGEPLKSAVQKVLKKVYDLTEDAPESLKDIVELFNLEERREIFVEGYHSLGDGLAAMGIPLYPSGDSHQPHRSAVWSPGRLIRHDFPTICFHSKAYSDLEMFEKNVKQIKMKYGSNKHLHPTDIIDLWNVNSWQVILQSPVFVPSFLLVDNPAACTFADDILYDFMRIHSDSPMIVGIDFEFVSSKIGHGPPTAFTETEHRNPLKDHAYNQDGGTYIALLQLYPIGTMPLIYSLGDTMKLRDSVDSSGQKRQIFTLHKGLRKVLRNPQAKFIGSGLHHDNLAVFNMTGIPLFPSHPKGSNLHISNAYLLKDNYEDLQSGHWSTDGFTKIQLEQRADKFLNSALTSTDKFPINYVKSPPNFSKVWDLTREKDLELLEYSATDSVLPVSLAFNLALTRLQANQKLSTFQKQLIALATADIPDLSRMNYLFDNFSAYYTNGAEIRQIKSEIVTKFLPQYTTDSGVSVSRFIVNILIHQYFRDFVGRFDPVVSVWMVRRIAYELYSAKALPPILGYIFSPPTPDQAQSVTFLQKSLVGTLNLDDIVIVVDAPTDSALQQQAPMENLQITFEVEKEKEKKVEVHYDTEEQEEYTVLDDSEESDQDSTEANSGIDIIRHPPLVHPPSANSSAASLKSYSSPPIRCNPSPRNTSAQSVYHELGKSLGYALESKSFQPLMKRHYHKHLKMAATLCQQALKEYNAMFRNQAFHKKVSKVRKRKFDDIEKKIYEDHADKIRQQLKDLVRKLKQKKKARQEKEFDDSDTPGPSHRH